MDRYRTGAYAADNPDWHDGDAIVKAHEVRALLAAAGFTPRSVVDVGCGTGGVLADLLGPDQTGTGLDVAAAAIERATSKARPGLSFRVGTVDDAPVADLTLCLDVAEHVPDDVGLLRSLRRISDRVVVRLPLDASAWDALRPARMLRARSQYGHLRAYTLDLARALVDDAGLDVEREAFVAVPGSPERALGHVTQALRRVGRRVAPAATARLLGGCSWLALATFRPQGP